MVRHVVMWKVDESALADAESVARVAGDLSARLQALTDVIPGIVSMSAAPNGVAAAGNWDFALVADFADEEALEAYATHPAHLEVVAKIRAATSARAAVDLII